MRRASVLVGCVLVLGLGAADAAKCFEGKVTYCGINADGGALAPPNSKRFVEGMNWACEDQLSNLDPTYIAPYCHDKASCEDLQTVDIDDPFEIEHASPYTYVSDVAYLSKARSLNGTATKTCPPDHPACGLQTTLREAKDEDGKMKACTQCYTRFRYTADIGAIYWRVFQIEKRCIPEGQTERCPDLNETGCWCTAKAPFYQGGKRDPKTQLPTTDEPKYCSPWAKAACRRKVYKCMHFPADYVMTTFQDYDIKFCSIGSDNEICSGCVACTDERCQQPVIHVSKLLKGTPDYSDPATYNCSLDECGEAPRTCWNKTCAYTDDCWPECDGSVYQQTLPGAKMGFYVNEKPKMVELTKCCDTDYCNFPNAAARPSVSLLSALLLSLVAYGLADAGMYTPRRLWWSSAPDGAAHGSQR